MLIINQIKNLTQKYDTMYCKVPLETCIFAPHLKHKTPYTMKNTVLTIAALITLSAESYAANLDAKYLYKERGEEEKIINVNLPEVVIQDSKTGSRIEKARIVNGELLIVHYLPAIEITAKNPVNEQSALKAIREVQLPEVVIEGSVTDLNYRSAQVKGNEIVPVVQLAEVTVTAKADKGNNEVVMTESENNNFKPAFNMPAVSVEFTLLAGIISLLLSIIFPSVG